MNSVSIIVGVMCFFFLIPPLVRWVWLFKLIRRETIVSSVLVVRVDDGDVGNSNGDDGAESAGDLILKASHEPYFQVSA
jgi:hypothetical protein